MVCMSSSSTTSTTSTTQTPTTTSLSQTLQAVDIDVLRQNVTFVVPFVRSRSEESTSQTANYTTAFVAFGIATVAIIIAMMVYKHRKEVFAKGPKTRTVVHSIPPPAHVKPTDLEAAGQVHAPTASGASPAEPRSSLHDSKNEGASRPPGGSDSVNGPPGGGENGAYKPSDVIPQVNTPNAQANAAAKTTAAGRSCSQSTRRLIRNACS